MAYYDLAYQNNIKDGQLLFNHSFIDAILSTYKTYKIKIEIWTYKLQHVINDLKITFATAFDFLLFQVNDIRLF